MKLKLFLFFTIVKSFEYNCYSIRRTVVPDSYYEQCDDKYPQEGYCSVGHTCELRAECDNYGCSRQDCSCTTENGEAYPGVFKKSYNEVEFLQLKDMNACYCSFDPKLNSIEISSTNTNQMPTAFSDEFTSIDSANSVQEEECDIEQLYKCEVNNLLSPHPDTCEKYFQCDNGKLISRSCPDGTMFNPQINYCDWPNSFTCINYQRDFDQSFAISCYENCRLYYAASFNCCNFCGLEVNKTINEPMTEPLTDAPTGPITKPVTTAVTGAKTEPVTTAVTEPVIELVTTAETEPVTTAGTEPVTTAVTESVTTAVREGLTKAVTKPVTELVTTAVTKAVTEPITELVTDSVTKLVTKSATQLLTETVTKAVTASVNKSATQPSTEPVTHLVTQPITEALTNIENELCEDEISAHSERCDTFCHCKNGIKSDIKCPDQFLFNSKIGACDFPENVKCSHELNFDHYGTGCKTGIYAHPLKCDTFYQCYEGYRYENLQCPDGLLFNSKSKFCDWPENVNCAQNIQPIKCSRGERRVHEDDCKKFYECLYFGAEIVRICHDEMIFNEKKLECEIPFEN